MVILVIKFCYLWGFLRVFLWLPPSLILWASGFSHHIGQSNLLDI